METLDQEFNATGGDKSFAGLATRKLCQTFTCGMSGGLTQVSMLMDSVASNNRPAVISILGTTGGLPDSSNVLWTGNLDTMADGWFDIDTSSGTPSLVNGTSYGIQFESTFSSPDSNAWLTYTTGGYSGGKLYEDRGVGWVSVSTSGTPYPNTDAGFKTYMTPQSSGNFFQFI